MKLPSGNLAVVSQEKLTEYLLNPSHPDNGGKALFFQSLGFRRAGPESLASSLRQLAISADITEIMESAHGIKYIVDACIETQSGKTPSVRTVWIIDRGQSLPRLVTAYPRQEQNL